MLLALCPLAFAASNRKKIYGARDEADLHPGSGDVIASPATVGGYLLATLLAIALWLYPMVTAFQSSSAGGIVWGVGILIFPLLGIVYLLLGCCATSWSGAGELLR
jgi:hypothetical protein